MGQEKRSGDRRRSALVAYLLGAAAFTASYLSFTAGTNGFHRDAWLWGLCAACATFGALVVLWRSRSSFRSE